MHMLFVWIAVIIGTLVLEALTAQMVSVWFALGGAAGLIAYVLHLPPWPQVLVFAVVTLLLLICTRPFVRKLMKTKPAATNADRYIGEIGLVSEEINNEENLGQVRVRGSVWTARTEGARTVERGTEVKILRIEGVKLIVEPLESKEKNESPKTKQPKAGKEGLAPTQSGSDGKK